MSTENLAFLDELSVLPVGLAAPFGGTSPAVPTVSRHASPAPSPGPNLKTEGGELVFVAGLLQLVFGKAAIRQAAECRLRTFRDEWFLDGSIGVPWVEQVLGRKAAAAPVRAVIREELLAIPGVTGIGSLALRFDPATRSMSITFVLHTAGGDVAGSVTP